MISLPASSATYAFFDTLVALGRKYGHLKDNEPVAVAPAPALENPHAPDELTDPRLESYHTPGTFSPERAA